MLTSWKAISPSFHQSQTLCAIILYNVSIIFYDITISSQGNPLYNNAATGTIVSNQSLVLQSVSRNNAGIYTCIGSNQEGDGHSNPLNLDIKCKKFSALPFSNKKNLICKVQKKISKKIDLLLRYFLFCHRKKRKNEFSNLKIGFWVSRILEHRHEHVHSHTIFQLYFFLKSPFEIIWKNCRKIWKLF